MDTNANSLLPNDTQVSFEVYTYCFDTLFWYMILIREKPTSISLFYNLQIWYPQEGFTHVAKPMGSVGHKCQQGYGHH